MSSDAPKKHQKAVLDAPLGNQGRILMIFGRFYGSFWTSFCSFSGNPDFAKSFIFPQSKKMILEVHGSHFDAKIRRRIHVIFRPLRENFFDPFWRPWTPNVSPYWIFGSILGPSLDPREFPKWPKNRPLTAKKKSGKYHVQALLGSPGRMLWLIFCNLFKNYGILKSVHFPIEKLWFSSSRPPNFIEKPNRIFAKMTYVRPLSCKFLDFLCVFVAFLFAVCSIDFCMPSDQPKKHPQSVLDAPLESQGRIFNNFWSILTVIFAFVFLDLFSYFFGKCWFCNIPHFLKRRKTIFEVQGSYFEAKIRCKSHVISGTFRKTTFWFFLASLDPHSGAVLNFGVDVWLPFGPREVPKMTKNRSWNATKVKQTTRWNLF